MLSLFFLVGLFNVPETRGLSVGTRKAPIRPTLASTSLAYRSAVDAGIHIGPSSEEKGLGAFSKSPIAFGTLVGKYIGERLTSDEVKARYWGKAELNDSDLQWMASRRERGQGLTGNYIFEMKDGSFVDAEDGDYGGWCRFMNHAFEGTAECNIKAFNQQTTGGPSTIPYFYAIRDIAVGEELCYDYGGYFYDK